MDWIVASGSWRRRELVDWTPETRWLFQQIINDAAGVPGLRATAGTKRVRPVIFVNRKIAVIGFEDGIAARLDPEQTQQVLQIPGCLLRGKGDPRFMRGMVSLPWSAREHWRDLARSAIAAVQPS